MKRLVSASSGPGGTMIHLLVTSAALTAFEGFSPLVHADPPQRPPIPVRFRLDEPAFITLVIERRSPAPPDMADKPDPKNKLPISNAARQSPRVKNLVANTWYPAGEHTVWWDGLDESNAHPHLIPGEALYYRILGSLVSEGEYRVRGLTRQAVAPKYEFAVYSGGQSPPWKTKDNRGGWLADHTPPASALFLPGSKDGNKEIESRVLLGCWVAEAGDGLVVCDLEGRRVDGTRGIGAGDHWGGAAFLARDVGAQHVPKQDVYLAGHWTDKDEVWAIGPNWSGKKLFTYKFPRTEDWITKESNVYEDSLGRAVGGLAVRDSRIALSLPTNNLVLLIHAATGVLVGRTEIRQPRGLAFDGSGRLFVVSGQTVTAWKIVSDDSGPQLTQTTWQPRVSFDDPHGIALDDQGRIYVSDWGKSHQVKVLGPDGELIRTIGHPGEPCVGPYDPLHMNQPTGLTITSDGQLWVAENWFVPKRVSIWTLEGELVKAMYGPTSYGGGGSIDPRDRTRCFVHGEGGGMEFKLDWERGTSQLKQVYYLPGRTGMTPPTKFWKSFPEKPVWVGERLYLSNCFTGGPTSGEEIVSLWHYRDGVAIPVASLGDTAGWDLLSTEPFKARWPKGVKATPGEKVGAATFAWCDLNDDAQVQPDEVQIVAGPPGSLTLDGELCLTTTTALRYAPVGFTAKGAPRYDLSRGSKLNEGVRPIPFRDNGQVIAALDGWTVFTFPPEPLPGCYLAGTKDGRLTWTYPEEYMGLAASHHAPKSRPPGPGELIGGTRLLGPSFLAPRTGNPRADSIELWAINANYGNIHLFTTDGLFVATLFQDSRFAKAWPGEEKRGADLNGVSLSEECFFPSIQRMADGRVYVIAGQPFSGIFEITGLDTIRRLPEQDLTITAEHIAAARRYHEAHPSLSDNGAKEPAK